MRKFDIQIDGKPFIEPTKQRQQFRVVFRTQTNYTENLNFFDLSIYNLSRSTVINEGQKIVFSAGYDDEYDVIFSGVITSVLVEAEGVNKVTKLYCVSNRIDRRKTINVGLGKNSTVIQALRACASAWGLSLKVDKEQFKDSPLLTSGYVLEGDIPSCLRKLAKMFDFGWAQVNQFLIVDRKGKEIKGKPREISLFTGMIGVPQSDGDITGTFVNVSTRLSPKIRLATNVNIQSEYSVYRTGNLYIKPPENKGNLSGVYKVIAIEHVGDSWGEDWRTNLRVQKVNGE